jgi:hypothetical protein
MRLLPVRLVADSAVDTSVACFYFLRAKTVSFAPEWKVRGFLLPHAATLNCLTSGRFNDLTIQGFNDPTV